MASLADVLPPSISASNPWLVIVVAVGPTVASGVWLVWKWWSDRHDKAEEAELSADEREAVRLERERQTLSAGQQQLFSTVSAENERLRGELTTIRKDRDRGWRFARLCEERASKLWHLLTNTRQMVDSQRELAKLPPVKWPDAPPVPNEEEIAA